MPNVPLTPEGIKQAEQRAENENYARRLPVALDIGLDEAAGGPMDMTISTRMWLWSKQKGFKGWFGR